MKKWADIWFLFKGGIVGALLFAICGVILLLLAIGYVPDLPYFKIGTHFENWKRTWTDNGLLISLFIASLIGFAVGVKTRRRYSRLIEKSITPLVVLGIFAIITFWFLHIIAMGMRIPQRTKLIDCTNAISSLHFQVPRGSSYSFEFSSSDNFSCRLDVSSGSYSTNFLITKNRETAHCDFLTGQTNCDLKIVFEQQPSQPIAVWLHWLQPLRDREK